MYLNTVINTKENGKQKKKKAKKCISNSINIRQKYETFLIQLNTKIHC